MVPLAHNIFQEKLWVKINSDTHTIHQALLQRFPVSGLLFCIGMDNLIQSISETISNENKNMWYYDDGYIVGRKEQIETVWRILKAR